MTNRCLHWGHHLLRQCAREAVFEGLCGEHYLSCNTGCPPVRLVWWHAADSVGWYKIRIGKGKDEYGNVSRYAQVPVLGTLIVFGGFHPLSHLLEAVRPDSKT